MHRLLSAIRNLFRRERAERELDAEIRSYSSMLEENNMSAGMNRNEARRAANSDMGGEEQVKELVRDARAGAWLESLLQDVRLAGRMMRKNPGFTLVAVITLALGIGANAGVFSVVNGVLLNPLPYPHPEQLVAIHESKPNFATGSISFPNFKDWERNNRTFTNMAVSRGSSAVMTGAGEPERIRITFVSSSFFRTLGIRPVAGRDFTQTEDEAGSAPVAILNYEYWQRKFEGSLAVIGNTVELGGSAYTVVGVVTFDDHYLARSSQAVQMFIPIAQWGNNLLFHRNSGLGIHGVGRMKPGVTIEQARADMAGVTDALAQQYPDVNKGIGAALVPLRQEMLGSVRPVLLLLFGAVGFVLLIACANVGNLMLSRASSREREVAIRSALGASAARLIRQLLTESVLLAVIGAGLGLAIAVFGTRAVLNSLPSALPRAAEVRLDLKVLLFTTGISVLSGLLFGLVPALKISRGNVHTMLQESGRGNIAGKQRTQGVFVVLQLAMAIVLLTGAGLMIRTLASLWRVDTGFQPDNILTFGLSMPPAMSNAPPETIRAAFRDIETRFSHVSGVEAVSLSWGAMPLNGDDEELFWMHGQPEPTSMADMNWALRYLVGPDYLKVMRTRLLRGRFFTTRDDNHSPLVVVIDEEFARKYFGSSDPIGERIHLDSPRASDEAEIIGVVEHVKQWGLDTDDKQQLRAEMYRPILQLQDGVVPQVPSGFAVFVRYQGSEQAVFDALRSASSAMSRQQTIYGAETMNETIARTLSARRFSMFLLGAFAVLALVLATLGVYGVISYSVGRRTNEIGIRMALGARRSEVLRLIVGEGMRLALIGTVLGICAALALTRFLSNLLFGVSAHDLMTFAATSATLIVVAALASWIPARRAMNVDPMIALRHE